MWKSYPLNVRNDRVLPASYDGPAFIWDIDKTYLSTRFSSWQGLLRIPLELAIDKQAIPGMPEVLRGIRRGAARRVACHPLYFVSASPPFLRQVIQEKMLRDGVEQDGITFKDWLGTFLELRPDRLLDQLGFKTAALLRGRKDRTGAQEYLFGDDYEQDPEAFSLYARWINQTLEQNELAEALLKGGVRPSDVEKIVRAAVALPNRRGTVNRIYIHLERGTPPEKLRHWAPLLVPVRGAYQLALALREAGLIDAKAMEATQFAVESMKNYYLGNTRDLYRDAVKRGIVKKAKTRIAKRQKESTRFRRHSSARC